MPQGSKPVLVVASASQVEPATRIVGDRYDVIWVEQAWGLTDRDVLIWPNGADVSYEQARQLVPVNERVRVMAQKDQADAVTLDFKAFLPFARDGLENYTEQAQQQASAKESDAAAGNRPPVDGESSPSTIVPSASDHKARQMAESASLGEAPPVAASGTSDAPLNAVQNAAQGGDWPRSQVAVPDDSPDAAPYDEQERDYSAEREYLGQAHDQAPGPPKKADSEALGRFWTPPPSDSDEWGKPADFWQGVMLPEITADMLPEGIAGFALDQAQIIGVDPCQTALNCLCTCAAAMHEQIKVQCLPGSEWREGARIWGAVVGDASTKKGPALDRCIGPLLEIDRRFRQTNESIREEYEIQEKIYQGRLADYVRESKKNATAYRPDKPEPPQMVRIYTDDTTKESAAQMCAQNPRGRIAIIKDELASWVGSFSAYSSQKGTEKDRSDWLSAYEGKPRYIDRVTAGKSIYVPHWSAVIFGGIQPTVISRFAQGMNGQPGMAEDGMLARFMIVVSRPASEGVERQPDAQAKAQYTRILENLVNMQPGPNIRLSSDAQEYRADKSRWIHKAMRSGLQPAMVSALGKWEGLHMRLSTLFAAIDAADHAQSEIPQVNLDHVATAWRWMEGALFPHMWHFYNVTVGTADAHDPARELASRILAWGNHEVTTSQAWKGWTGYRKLTKAQSENVWQSLVLGSWLKQISRTRFAVNPAVFSTFKDQADKAKAERLRLAALMPESWKQRHAAALDAAG